MPEEPGDICGAPTDDDTACKNPPSEEGDSGRCWIPAHNEAADEMATSGPGRKTKLQLAHEEPARSAHDEFIDPIMTVIESGGSISEAARKAGIHRQRIYTWAEKGENLPEDSDDIHRTFRDRFVRAKGTGEGTYRRALIKIAMENNDTATLMAMLKQRYPGPWGHVDRGQQSGMSSLEVVIEDSIRRLEDGEDPSEVADDIEFEDVEVDPDGE